MRDQVGECLPLTQMSPYRDLVTFLKELLIFVPELQLRLVLPGQTCIPPNFLDILGTWRRWRWWGLVSRGGGGELGGVRDMGRCERG